MAALLTAESQDTDKIVEGIAECKKMGILVLPPDINTSWSGFSIEENVKSLNDEAIRFGLNAIKNVGEAALSEILGARKKGGEFKSFCDFYLRVNGQKVNKKVLESLIKAGAMDKFGKRAAMLAGLDSLRNKCDLILKQKSQGQASLFGGNPDDISIPDDNFPNIDEFKKEELMSIEKELLGFFLTEHPLSAVLSILELETDEKIGSLDLESVSPGQRIKLGGILSSLRIVVTKKNNSEMAFGTLEDDTGKIELVIFPKTYSTYKEILIKDRTLIIEGRVEVREETLTIVVDKGQVLNGDEGKKYDFLIRVRKETSSKTLMELNKLLRDNPGEKMGVLIFENGDHGKKKLELRFGVNYTPELKEKIESILKNEDI